ncbi:MAG: dTDP-4-dehydrorhamnose reductase [Anaerolineaceae bacterium]|nr:dTDP-4-dehydrorhamnose reductase [Anaerolineaceae bacterium]|tara:strand:+ start:39708 stop:40544 length:837 start_codon:yes stop_codon:yes gene_type:complete
MRYFVTGARGQLGATLVDMLPSKSVFPINLPEYDVTDIDTMRNAFDRWSVDVVIHCAAYTNVDGCALNPELANLVNAIGTRNIAHLCAEYGAVMVLLSTNEVFDGRKPYSYTERDIPGAINPYGESKLAAERYILDILERYYIVRTSWMYAAGGANFVHTILNLASQGEDIAVVTDELGVPTYAKDLASAIIEVVDRAPYGIYHLVNSGHVSRYGFARQVLNLTGYSSLAIKPILLEEYERESCPPRNGILSNWAASSYGIALRPWQTALAEFLTDVT